jgi:hypothetical protein
MAQLEGLEIQVAEVKSSRETEALRLECGIFAVGASSFAKLEICYMLHLG